MRVIKEFLPTNLDLTMGRIEIGPGHELGHGEQFKNR